MCIEHVCFCALLGAQVHAVFCVGVTVCLLVCACMYSVCNKDTCHDVCSGLSADGSKVVVSVKWHKSCGKI